MKQMMEINADVSKAKTMSIVIIHWSTVICHWESRSAIVASLKMACSGGPRSASAIARSLKK